MTSIVAALLVTGHESSPEHSARHCPKHTDGFLGQVPGFSNAEIDHGVYRA